ncbi:MAG: cation:proton antiporter [Bacteroidales bacterium]|nr:cation:proton antiporter [Bacteroidales bacterium]
MNLLTISFHFDYLPLLIVAGIAWLVPVLMSLVRLDKAPTIIVEIIAGYFVGKALLGDFPAESLQPLEFLALSGFMFLMFMSGLEIDIDQIKASLPRKRIKTSTLIENPLLVGLLIFISTLLLSFIGSYILSGFFVIRNVWYFSLIMVTSSVGIILPILKERGETRLKMGQMIILAAAVADILSIILFIFSAYIIRNGFDFELLLILILFVAFFVAYLAGNFLKRLKLLDRITYQLSHASSQIKIRGTIVLILVFVALAQGIGEEVMLLGAFLAGILVSMFMHKGRSLLMIKLDGMAYGFFIPIFFIMVGVRFNPADLAALDNSVFVFLGILIILLYAVKILPSMILARSFGNRKALAGGILLSSRLSLIIAASKIGLDLGIVSPAMNASFIIMAVVTCLLSPVIYNAINPRTILTADKTLVVGGSSTGVLLARRLKMQGRSAIIIEKDKDRYDEMNSKGLNTYLGDGRDPNIYRQLHLEGNNYIVVHTGAPHCDMKITRMLKNHFQHENIITTAENVRMERELQKLKVEPVDRVRIQATTIENLIIRPTTYHTLVETFEGYIVAEVEITSPHMNRLKLKSFPWHKDATLMLVRHDGEMHVPHGDTMLHTGDVLTIFGTSSAIKYIREQVGLASE